MTIDKSLCVNCGACVTACSMGIFRRDESGEVVTRDRPCMDCYHCAAACPRQAVEVPGLSRAELYPAPSAEPMLAALQRRRSIRHFSDELPARAAIQHALEPAADEIVTGLGEKRRLQPHAGCARQHIRRSAARVARDLDGCVCTRDRVNQDLAQCTNIIHKLLSLFQFNN